MKILSQNTKMTNNISTVLKFAFAVFVVYYLVYVLTPIAKVNSDHLLKIDSINNQIKVLQQSNDSLENNIKKFDTQITNIDGKIKDIKAEKQIIREYYYEKINNVDKLTISQLDSFFSKRYNY